MDRLIDLAVQDINNRYFISIYQTGLLTGVADIMVSKKREDANEIRLGDQLVWEWLWCKVPSILLYYHPCMIYRESTQVHIVLLYTKS